MLCANIFFLLLLKHILKYVYSSRSLNAQSRSWNEEISETSCSFVYHFWYGLILRLQACCKMFQQSCNTCLHMTSCSMTKLNMRITTKFSNHDAIAPTSEPRKTLLGLPNFYSISRNSQLLILNPANAQTHSSWKWLTNPHEIIHAFAWGKDKLGGGGGSR